MIITVYQSAFYVIRFSNLLKPYDSKCQNEIKGASRGRALKMNFLKIQTYFKYFTKSNSNSTYQIQGTASKSGREYFRLGAESYSSIGRVGKREENSRVHFRTFSPVDKFRVLACIG